MAENLMGVCQVCGRRLEFPPERSGQTMACPNCGRNTRLKPAPVELLEAAPAGPVTPPAAPPVPPPPGSAPEPDATLSRIKRSYLKLLILTVILLGMLLALVWVAEWLHALARQ